jgi:DNA-binding Lrp family transcriptional regulator
VTVNLDTGPLPHGLHDLIRGKYCVGHVSKVDQRRLIAVAQLRMPGASPSRCGCPPPVVTVVSATVESEPSGRETHMIDAYVLIQTEIGMMAQVAASLRQIPGVSNAVVVTGPYDVIARVTAVDMDSIGRLIVSEIQAVGGVVRTLTCQVVHL